MVTEKIDDGRKIIYSTWYWIHSPHMCHAYMAINTHNSATCAHQFVDTGQSDKKKNANAGPLNRICGQICFFHDSDQISNSLWAKSNILRTEKC